MVFKHSVSVTNNRARVCIVFQKKYGMNAFFSTDVVRNDRDVSDTGSTIHGAFDVFRKDVQSFRSHDHFFLTTANTKTAI